MSEAKMTRKDCVELLRSTYTHLQERGLSRYPQRSDFADREVVAIKACFGPWPRALEAAGIKPSRSDDRSARNHEKRIRSKRRRREAEKQAKQQAVRYTAGGVGMGTGKAGAEGAGKIKVSDRTKGEKA